MKKVDFFVAGDPAPQGSTRAFYNRRAGRVIVTTDSKRTYPWRTTVSYAAQQAIKGDAPISVGVEVQLRFYLRPPKSVVRKDGTFKRPPITRPDLDKLIRCCLDAFTGIIFGDDSQVVKVEAVKSYGKTTGVGVSVTALDG